MLMNSDMNCPCHSGKSYESCCASFHRGKEPSSALELMRSRYSAYALSLVDYILKTTHPSHSDCKKARAKRIKEIEAFCKNTQFANLTILEVCERGNWAQVTFKAHLFQNHKDVSFQEKSSFEKVDGRWLYLSGQVST